MTTPRRATLSFELLEDASVVLDFTQLHEAPRPSAIAIAMVNDDATVARLAAELFSRALFEKAIFIGFRQETQGNGSMARFRDLAVREGLPPRAILGQRSVRTFAEGVTASRAIAQREGSAPASALVLCRPSQERRAGLAFERLWPALEVTCCSCRQPLLDHMHAVGDPRSAMNGIVRDAEAVFEAAPAVPSEPVRNAYQRLVEAGFGA